MLCLSFSSFFFLMLLHPLRSTLFPYTTLFRSLGEETSFDKISHVLLPKEVTPFRIDFDGVHLNQVKKVTERGDLLDRKSTRLNSSHRCISYAVFCLKKKKNMNKKTNC